MSLFLTVIIFKTLPLIKNGSNIVSKSSSAQSLQIKNIKEIERDVNVGKQYIAELTVTKYSTDTKSQTKFLVLRDGSDLIDAVIFKEVTGTDFIKVNSKYKITGTLNIYQSKYELIVRKIEELTN